MANSITNSLRSRLLAMNPGDVLTVSADTYSGGTVRAYASDLSFTYLRRYTTSRNREDRTYTITRLQ